MNSPDGKKYIAQELWSITPKPGALHSNFGSCHSPIHAAARCQNYGYRNITDSAAIARPARRNQADAAYILRTATLLPMCSIHWTAGNFNLKRELREFPCSIYINSVV